MSSAEHKEAAEEILAELEQEAGEHGAVDLVDRLGPVLEFALRRALIHATLATIPDPAPADVSRATPSGAAES
jgi:hypothetical protein